MLDNILQNVAYVCPFLGGNTGRIGSIQADDILDLLAGPLDIGGGKIDFIDDRNDFQVIFKGEVDVCERLRLDALRGVHDQNRPFARGERAGDLVGKVDMAGRVDEVEFVFVAVVRLVKHAHRSQFNGNSPLPLQIHRVEELILHVARGNLPRKLHDPVCNGALAVVDMRYNAEIADIFARFCHSFLRRAVADRSSSIIYKKHRNCNRFSRK